MSLSSLQHKVGYIKDKISPYVQNELESHFGRVFANLKHVHELAPYLQGLIFIDLCYIAARHHIWLRHRLLLQASIAYLSEEYKMAGDCGHALVTSVFNRLGEYTPPPARPFFYNDDKNFLLYVFVTALAAKDNRQLITDLGLGTQLLVRLQHAAKYLSDYQKNSDKVFFQADHDADMIAAITELSERKSRSPWATDHYRLLYRTADVCPPFGPWLEEEGVLCLFNFLLYLGQQGSLSSDEGLTWFNLHAHLPDEAFIWSQGGLLFYEELTKRDLIAPSPVPLRKQAGAPAKSAGSPSFYYQLSAFGYEVTADAFALQQRHNLLEADAVSRLSPPWQAAYFRHLPLEERSYIKRLLSEKIRLHPEAIELAVGKLSCNSDLNELFFDLVKIAKSGVPTIRAAVCRALSQLKTLTQVSEELSQIARTDGSALVRDAALEELRKTMATQALAVYRQIPLASGKIA